MADTPAVATDHNSGAYEVILPPGKKESRVDVSPESKLHPVLADTTDNPDPQIEERRKHPAPVQVSVQQPPAGGLTGWPATIANMSAVAFVLILSFIMYRDFVGTVKERDALIREEMRLNREAADRNVQAIGSRLDALAISNNALATEHRASRVAMEARLDKVLEQLTKKGP